MALFFTADTHFGDHRTINIHHWPFTDVAAMDAAIVAGWKRLTTPSGRRHALGRRRRRTWRSLAADDLPSSTSIYGRSVVEAT